MASPAKQMKLELDPEELIELQGFQDQIRKIKGLPDREATLEHDYNVAGETSAHQTTEEDIKTFIREEIQQSERRIQTQLDCIEMKLNQIIQHLSVPEITQVEDLVEEEVAEYLDGNELEAIPEDSIQMDRKIFPISDEVTFEWFFEKLKDDSYRDALIERRWHLTKRLEKKSFNSSVKAFLKTHFDLSICVGYSVSGYGSHGTKKKKFDSETLTTYVYECFNRLSPDVHSEKEVYKALLSFWGRASDNLSKTIKSKLKHESSE